jgi:hypothetical protein
MAEQSKLHCRAAPLPRPCSDTLAQLLARSRAPLPRLPLLLSLSRLS